MNSTATETETGIVFSEQSAGHSRCIAFARLNAERTLNALSSTMINALQAQLDAWATRDDIVCVVLHGSGEKAFSAGGDVVGVYRALHAAGDAPSPDAEHFFACEYRLDHTIHRYPKPVLCWGNGTVIGGGLGILAGASHRVVTERSRLAMPEVTIGLFPDVGASWFFGRMPNRIGLFLGLTAMPMEPGDALWLGLADYRLTSDTRDALFDALAELDWQTDPRANDAVLARALRDFEDTDAADEARRESPLFAYQGAIARLTDTETVAEFQTRLETEAARNTWFDHGARTVASASPTSLAVTHRQLARDARLSIERVFRQELAMAVQCTRRPDFAEGIRALLIDKDKTPQWTPARLTDVDASDVTNHFALPDDYRQHPLADL